MTDSQKIELRRSKVRERLGEIQNAFLATRR